MRVCECGHTLREHDDSAFCQDPDCGCSEYVYDIELSEDLDRRMDELYLRDFPREGGEFI